MKNCVNDVILKTTCQDFLGDPVVKTSTSNAGGVGSIPSQRSHMAQGQKNKT